MGSIRLRTAALAAAATVTVSLAGVATGAQAATSTATQDHNAQLASSGALTAGAASSAVHAGANVDKAIKDYWTADRMKAAKTADLPALNKAAAKSLQTRGPAGTAGPSGRVAGAKATVGAAAKATETSATTTAAANATAAAADVTSALRWTRRYTPPASTTGKVFFTKVRSDGVVIGNYVCSGSAVNSEAKNLVVTAGHCVHGGSGYTWHRNWLFVPDYYYNNRPYGSWTARSLNSFVGWTNSSDFRYDVGMVVTRNNVYGQRLVNVTGGQGISWNWSRPRYVYDFGYPAASPFDGQALYYCADTTFNDFWSGNANLGIDCNMTGGSSGGPWITSFTGYYGYLYSVNSYKYGWLPNNIYGPYFGTHVGNLYNALRYAY